MLNRHKRALEIIILTYLLTYLLTYEYVCLVDSVINVV